MKVTTFVCDYCRNDTEAKGRGPDYPVYLQQEDAGDLHFCDRDCAGHYFLEFNTNRTKRTPADKPTLPWHSA
jgi:hypothetical protein